MPAAAVASGTFGGCGSPNCGASIGQRLGSPATSPFRPRGACPPPDGAFTGGGDRALAEQIIRDQETLAALHATVLETREATNTLRQETAVQKKELDKQLEAL